MQHGYFFMILVTLYISYRILNTLKDGGMKGKYSVNEVLMELSGVYMVSMGA